MAERKFDLGDYVEVKDRLAILYELYPQARLVTEDVTVLTAPDDKQRVMVKALVYRTPDDPHPAVGHSWMELPGTTSYTKGSELENTETSAWGRAIAALGILVDKSIASAQEVQNKQSDAPKRGSGMVSDTPFADAPPLHDEPIEHNGIGGLVGTVEKGKPPVDMEVRYSKDEGAVWGFALKDGRTKFQALAKGDLAERLANREIPEGIRVTVWGPVEAVPWDKKMTDGTVRVLHFNRIALERVKGPDFDLSAPVEAPSLPLPFDPVESARLDAEEAAKAS